MSPPADLPTGSNSPETYLFGEQKPHVIGINDLPPPIQNEEDAIRWCEALLDDVRRARASCNLILHPAGDPARRQQMAYVSFILRYGSLLGVLGACLRLGYLQPAAYAAFMAAARPLLIPSMHGAPRVWRGR